MNRITKIIVLSFLPALLWMSDLSGQAKVIDRIAGVVGEFHILQSDIESMYLQNKAQGVSMPGDMKCNILEDFLSQKLLVNQAKIDSIEIPESNVEMSLESRIQYFTSMIGSQEALEEYFDKSIIEIKKDMRQSVREQLLTQEMQGTVTAGVTVTPSEIKEYYKSLHEDSIPYINSKVELSQITMYPPIDEEAIFDVKQRLLDLRRRIQEGEKFTTLAVLYSEGPSAPDGGDLGFFGRGQMAPEFTKAAFSLKEGGISTIVESSFGYHLIQLVERREDRVHARHIIMNPKFDPEVLRSSRMNVDSLADFIRMDSISFEMAAMRYSHDKHTAVNGGVMVNPVDNTTRFELDQLEASEYVALRDLKVGEISDAFESIDENQKQIFKIVKIMSQSEPHKANVKDDYDILLGMALEDKKNKVFQEWLDEKITETYVKVDDAYTGCKFSRDRWIKN